MDVLLRQLRSLKKLLRRRGATPDQAEDLVQEAVLRLHAHTRQGNQVQNQEAFLTRTALNLAVDQHRHARADSYESEPVENLELPDLEPTPDEVFAAEQRLMKMQEALGRANARTREVIARRAIRPMALRRVFTLIRRFKRRAVRWNKRDSFDATVAFSVTGLACITS